MIEQRILLLLPVCVIFQEQDFFLFISSSVNLLCFNMSGSVNDNDKTGDRACLTSPYIVAKNCSIYLLRILSIMILLQFYYNLGIFHFV